MYFEPIDAFLAFSGVFIIFSHVIHHNNNNFLCPDVGLDMLYNLDLYMAPIDGENIKSRSKSFMTNIPLGRTRSDEITSSVGSADQHVLYV